MKGYANFVILISVPLWKQFYMRNNLFFQEVSQEAAKG